jgi:hypothetical protein
MSQSYPDPVNKLLNYGSCEVNEVWPNYLELELGKEHITELIRMATDKDLHFAPSDSLEVYAPVHAWRALGQLRAEEAIEPLLPLFKELDAADWASEELPKVYGMIGPKAIPALARRIAESSPEVYLRVDAVHSLECIAKTHPEARKECISVMIKRLERFSKNDPTLNAFLISYLINLRATEAAELMQRAFEKGRVDLSVAGDWEDIGV